MNKQDFMKIQSCVLRVNIHCEGCKNKVKKQLQKIDGVYSVKIDSEQGKVTVAGDVDPVKLIKKLEKSGKHAEIWGAPKNMNSFNSQFKNMQQIQNSKGGKSGKSGKGFPMAGNESQKIGRKDLAPIAMVAPKDKKSVKFNLPEEDSEEFDDDFSDEFDDEYTDEEDEVNFQKMMPVMGKGSNGAMNLNAVNGKKGGEVFDFAMKSKAGINTGKNGGENGKSKGGEKKKGGGFLGFGKKGLFGLGGKSKNGGKKKSGNSDKNSSKKGVDGGGGKNHGNGAKHGAGKNDSFDKLDLGFHDMEITKHGKGGKGNVKNMGQMGHTNGKNMGHPMGHSNGNRGPMGQMGQMGPSGMNMGQMGGPNMGPMSNYPMGQMGQMGNFAAVQGLPAQPMMNGGYYQGMGPSGGPGQGPMNPYSQQYMAMMMNQQQQQRGVGSEMFQPMMYSRPNPAVNYGMPPPPGVVDPYTHFFSDENTNACSIM